MAESRVPPFHGNINFNAQHSPMGAFMSFTCGHFGTRGGFGLQIGKPGDQDLYIGVKDGDRFSDAPLKCLPFYEGATGGGASSFLVEQAGPAEQNVKPKAIPYRADQIKRHYGWATDTWVTEDFEFTIYTPFAGLPDPDGERPLTRHDLIPTVFAELVVDNRQGREPKTGFFAVQFPDPGVYVIRQGLDRLRQGFGHRAGYGFAGEARGAYAGDNSVEQRKESFAFLRWTPDVGLRELAVHALGNCPGIGFTVPPGERRSLVLALGCYVAGEVTTGIRASYYYARYFSSLADVLDGALDSVRHGSGYGGQAAYCLEEIDPVLTDSGLSPDQQFLIAHATRSYYGSTQLLDVGGQPFWVVNEGEYCMMNTLDLSVDHVFWELKHNPWVVKNLLDNFVRHYSYHDRVKGRDEETERRRDEVKEAHFVSPSLRLSVSSGGISFCHDMGAHNNFSPFGHSSYELPNLPGCFSYMTAEQLCNWILTAATYVGATNDLDWLRNSMPIIDACLASLINRGPENGIISRDSDRCESGSEITTYDSLDHSLAQTRNNAYIAVKTWAAYEGLALMYSLVSSPNLTKASEMSKRIVDALPGMVQSDGTLPAVFEEDNPGYRSRILPACEGLIYPLMWGRKDKLPSSLVALLKKHTTALLLDQEHRNLFPDGGIKLSSTSDNSWMSKIAIFQHIAREVFALDDDPKIRDLFAKADAAHVKWQTDGSGYWACSDQMVSGVAKGSRYYPRIITAALWMEGKRARGS